MPRGPGKKSNYNLDYSRFNNVAADEPPSAKIRAVEVPTQDGEEVPVTEIIQKMPPQLQEAYRLMAIARETGDEAAQKRANELALHAVKHGSIDVKQNFLNEVKKMSPESADHYAELLGLKEEEPLTDRIDRLRKDMQAGAEATKRQLEALDNQQRELESLQNAGPEDILKFMQKEGLNPEEMQRIFCGDQDFMENWIKNKLDKATDHTDHDKLATASIEAISAAEKLHATVCGEVTQTDGQQKVDDKPSMTASKEAQILIPEHRLQYQKDDVGRFTAVELICILPGIEEMSAIALDVNEKHLRLNTTDVPRYVVNAGPFPVLIEPTLARAKFSKKRNELRVTVPAKAPA